VLRQSGFLLLLITQAVFHEVFTSDTPLKTVSEGGHAGKALTLAMTRVCGFAKKAAHR
jgi:hypothetical protein